MAGRDSLTFFLLIVLAVFLRYTQKLWARWRLRLPPGPLPLPLFGNIFDIPGIKPWEAYLELSTKYKSELIFMDLPNQPTIVLNSTKSILALMEGHARLYASKAEAVMDDMTGWSWNLAFMPYGSRWRLGRRMFHQHFNQNAVKKYRPILVREIQRFLKRASVATAEDQLLDPQNIRQTLSAIILDITYGMQIHDMDNEYFSLARIAVKAMDTYRLPGTFWIEYFPWLKFLPFWAPGASAQRFAERWSPTIHALRDRAFDEVAGDMANGMNVPSVMQSLVEKLHNISEDTTSHAEFERGIRDVTGIAYAAGADTSSLILFSMLLGLVMSPRIQDKVHLELDTIVGPGRLPTPEDIPFLAYLQAVFMEALRWRPVLPLGVPRRVMANDEYMGYSIPAGTVILPNVWALLFDEERFPNPTEFNPDRFMRDGKLDFRDNDPTIAFGFGRRICPGRYLAKDTILLMMASLLHVFDLEPGTENISKDTNTGFVSIPTCPPCRLVPRNATATDLMNAVV